MNIGVSFKHLSSKSMGFAMALFILTQAVHAQPNYSDLLQTAVNRVSSTRSGVQLYLPSNGWNLPGPRFAPIRGLSDPNAVAFLINVFQSGPPWSSRGQSKDNDDLTRCYAALCLGHIGDPRALAPLLTALQQTDDNSPPNDNVPINLRRCAAFALGELGDANAVDPLVNVLQDQKWPECIYSLAKLEASQAADTIIQVAAEKGYYSGEMHRALQFMLKTDFRIEKVAAGYRIRELPQLGEASGGNVYKKLWQYWSEHGRDYAREQFTQNYLKLQQVKRENPHDHTRHRALQRKMLKGGVAALPYLIEAVDQGDKSLVPSVSDLVRSQRQRRTQAGGVRLRPDLRPQVQEKPWWKKHLQDMAENGRQDEVPAPRGTLTPAPGSRR